jgi:DNA-binding transcriptional MocR family regulator
MVVTHQIESMSYKQRLSDLDREASRSLTRQIVDAFAGAIAAGELGPGEKLPPTRELAELAGVNHLTAARAYRRLAELGLVAARVGQGTFVRDTAQATGSAVPDSIAWQRYALPDLEESAGHRAHAEMHRHVRTEGLIPLSVGYPSASLFPIEAIREAAAATLHAEPERVLQYSDPQGVPELAEQIVELSAADGAAEDPADVVITGGAHQALVITARALLRPGDVVACEDPSFMGVIEAVRIPGVQLLGVPTGADGLDVDALEALLARREIKLLALQSRVGNPIGRDLAPERRERLLALARRHGFFILEDGVYADLRFEAEAPASLRAEAPAHVIYVDSLSKTLGGGLRVGWVVASGPVLERILAEKRADDMHSPTLTQLTVARYLATGEYATHIERSRCFYAERRDILLAALDEHLGPVARYVRPFGGHHVWVALDLALDERELADEAIRRGVAYVPGEAMTVERQRALNLRLSFGFVEPDELVEGVRRLALAVEALRARPARAQALPV